MKQRVQSENSGKAIMKIILYITLFTLLTTQACSGRPGEDGQSASADVAVRNIIFMIGDGMGIGQVRAVSLQVYKGKQLLQLEQMPVTGLSLTHSADNIITDSAASGTAMSSGYKTRNRMIGMGPDTVAHQTILEAARARGLKTGLIATSTITHATPASFAAHVEARYMHNEIAAQILNTGPDLILGGGMQYFLPAGHDDSKRKDDRDLLGEAEKLGYTIVRDAQGLCRDRQRPR